LFYLSLRRAYGDSRIRTLLNQIILLSVHLLAAAVLVVPLFAITGLSV
jgi:hypothetical protein